MCTRGIVGLAHEHRIEKSQERQGRSKELYCCLPALIHEHLQSDVDGGNDLLVRIYMLRLARFAVCRIGAARLVGLEDEVALERGTNGVRRAVIEKTRAVQAVVLTSLQLTVRIG